MSKYSVTQLPIMGWSGFVVDDVIGWTWGISCCFSGIYIWHTIPHSVSFEVLKRIYITQNVSGQVFKFLGEPYHTVHLSSSFRFFKESIWHKMSKFQFLGSFENLHHTKVSLSSCVLVLQFWFLGSLENPYHIKYMSVSVWGFFGDTVFWPIFLYPILWNSRIHLSI